MTADFSNIHIFRTNIKTAFDKERIQPALDAHDTILKWNIDQKDIDCVLRIVSDTLTPQQIISVINCNGFECDELE